MDARAAAGMPGWGLLLRYALARAAYAVVQYNTGSEGTSGGEADDAHAARRTGRQGRGCRWDTRGTWANARAYGRAKEQEGVHGVAQQDCTQNSVRMKTRRRNKTQMFVASRLDTLYIL